MDKFNIFKLQYNAFNDMMSLAGQEVFINGAKKYGIITNTDTREFNDKYLSTNFAMMRGDYIYYNDMYWMIWNQVNVTRSENYKGIMRQCEHNIIFNLKYADETSKYLLKCPAVIQRTSDYTQHYQSTVSMVTIDSEIHVFVRDTSLTRKIMKLVGKSDGQIIIGNKNYSIIGVSVEKKGYLNITCRLDNTTSFSDYVNEIYWRETRPTDWESQIDDSLFYREGVTPTLPSAPNGLQTNVGEIKGYDIKNQTPTSLGEISFSWTHDDNKVKYREWEGYKVVFLKDNVEISTTTTISDSINYTNLQAGEYFIKVSILFNTYVEDEGSLAQTSNKFQIKDETVKPLPPNNYETNVSPMDIKAVGEVAEDGDGIVTYTWGKDVNAENYSGFVGYALYPYRNGTYSYSLNFDKDVMSYKWTNRGEGTYSGRICARFINGEIETLGSEKFFGNVTVQNNFDSGDPW